VKINPPPLTLSSEFLLERRTSCTLPENRAFPLRPAPDDPKPRRFFPSFFDPLDAAFSREGASFRLGPVFVFSFELVFPYVIVQLKGFPHFPPLGRMFGIPMRFRTCSTLLFLGRKMRICGSVERVPPCNFSGCSGIESPIFPASLRFPFFSATRRPKTQKCSRFSPSQSGLP